ncbi:MAG TPA: SDR family NAD(P)-dependent oxidoreductase [Acidimicrobiales bacterium]|nr:SDR family NAD(P)-dependent oxidoreductase [Acidimicrobiales bacterium]
MTWDLGAGLESRAVIVTGAAGGIGREVAKAFAAAGAKVLAVDRPGADAGGLLESLEGTDHRYRAVDLGDLSTHDALVAEARSAFGELYALVHLAAVLRRQQHLSDVREEDWDFQVDTNLKATFFLCRAAAEAMVEQGRGGRIITFTSQGWWTGGFGGSVVYNATKGGIVTMTRGMARTYGPHEITCNSIAPGQVRTPMLLTGLSDEVLETMTRATPLGRIAEPEEIAGVAVFLASRHAAFITGATINITGGFLMY